MFDGFPDSSSSKSWSNNGAYLGSKYCVGQAELKAGTIIRRKKAATGAENLLKFKFASFIYFYFNLKTAIFVCETKGRQEQEARPDNEEHREADLNRDDDNRPCKHLGKDNSWWRQELIT